MLIASRKGRCVIPRCPGQLEKDRGKETVPLLWLAYLR